MNGRTQSRGPGGATGFAVVLGVCVVVSLIAWIPLSAPTRFLRALFSHGGAFTLGSSACTSPGYACAFANVALTLLPAIIVSGVLFVIRRQLAGWLRALVATRLPDKVRFLLAPVIATLAFVMTWGYVHSASPYAIGLVPQVIFPALVGLFTFTTAQYGGMLAPSASRFVEARDKLPVWTRVVIVILVSLLVSLAMMHGRPVAFLDLKQQIAVLISLAIGFLALEPRGERVALDRSAVGSSGSSPGGRAT